MRWLLLSLLLIGVVQDVLSDNLAGGRALYEAGNFLEAIESLEVAATALNSGNKKAEVLNDLALAQEAIGDTGGASASLAAALAMSSPDQSPDLYTRIFLNQQRLFLITGKGVAMLSALPKTDSYLARIRQPKAKIELLLNAADLSRNAFWHFAADSDVLLEAVDWLKLAITISESNDTTRLQSFALGQLAQIYEDQGQYNEAILLGHRASFFAQQANARESLYQWQWLIARIKRKTGDEAAAVSYYEAAIQSLEPVRGRLIQRSPWVFREKIGPLYREYADLLLIQVSVSPLSSQQDQLINIRDLLENAKAAEVADYFQNDCVLPDYVVNADQLSPGTATIYPVILEDRMELLVSIDNQLYQFVSAVTQVQISEVASEFRSMIQNYDSEESIQEVATILYKWLIRPTVELLDASKIDTIVFVPDGPLRTIPISALYDGRQYLVEQYAIATTLGLQLTDASPLQISDRNMLASGISVSRQGMPALPGVVTELDMLQNTLGADRLQDKAFTQASIADRITSSSYSVVHVATHGRFDADPRESFLLTYDGLLSLNELSTLLAKSTASGDTVELLVLSACETAVGDERAALGLAGVALRAGARSAIASLWTIGDAATVRIMSTFYAELARNQNSKALALQLAQKELIRDSDFSHPREWAPFLMLGNWL